MSWRSTGLSKSSHRPGFPPPYQPIQSCTPGHPTETARRRAWVTTRARGSFNATGKSEMRTCGARIWRVSRYPVRQFSMSTFTVVVNILHTSVCSPVARSLARTSRLLQERRCLHPSFHNPWLEQQPSVQSCNSTLQLVVMRDRS